MFYTDLQVLRSSHWTGTSERAPDLSPFLCPQCSHLRSTQTEIVLLWTWLLEQRWFILSLRFNFRKPLNILVFISIIFRIYGCNHRCLSELGGSWVNYQSLQRESSWRKSFVRHHLLKVDQIISAWIPVARWCRIAKGWKAFFFLLNIFIITLLSIMFFLLFPDHRWLP